MSSSEEDVEEAYAEVAFAMERAFIDACDRRPDLGREELFVALLLLKDRMNTRTGRRLAVERHRFMERYLRQFYREWNGTR